LGALRIGITGDTQEHLRADFAANKRWIIIMLTHVHAMGAQLKREAPVIIDQKHQAEFVANRE
jgi:hypothetical protein